MLFAPGVERKQADSLPGRPGTGGGGEFILDNSRSLSPRKRGLSLEGLEDAGSWATGLGPALDLFIVDS